MEKLNLKKLNKPNWKDQSKKQRSKRQSRDLHFQAAPTRGPRLRRLRNHFSRRLYSKDTVRVEPSPSFRTHVPIQVAAQVTRRLPSDAPKWFSEMRSQQQ